MSSPTPSAPRRTLVAAAATVVAVSLLLPVSSMATPAAAEPEDGPGFSPVLSSVPSASEALANARAVVSGKAPASDLTLALRDLSARLPEYSGRDRAFAQSLLARPNGGNQQVENQIDAAWPPGSEAPGSPSCGTSPDICVHWTDTNPHQPPATDTNPANGVPDQVDRTLSEMTNVWQAEVTAAGFRAPLTDGRASKDAGGGFDVYLSDIGDGGYYGYCAIDDSRTFQTYAYFDRSGYCVLDDDYAEFGGPHTPLQNLQVTAAHEFFHAVQFAYDAYEDGWFMEGTAAWIEDEVYDAVNDNRQYLHRSQLTRPDKPLDTSNGITVYGSWGFFRYLSEKYGLAVVRKAWQRADSIKNAPDDYSLKGVRKAIESNGDTLGRVFGDYARANLAPGNYYEEGAAYPSPSVGVKNLGGSSKSTGWLSSRIDHMAIAYRAAHPNNRAGLNAKLRVKVDAPARSTGSQARVLVKYSNGSFATKRVSLDRRGSGAVKVDFGRNAVQRVFVTLANAGDSFSKCFRFKTQYSCGGGIPDQDNRRYSVKMSLA